MRRTQPTGAKNTGKTFTQEEVNQIVSNRLKEEREKMKKEQDASFTEREQKITAREMRMNALEKLQEKGCRPLWWMQSTVPMMKQ